MGRRITITGKNAQYIEHRGVNATPDNDREILMEGDEAVYQEYAYGQATQAKQEEKPTEDAVKEYQKEAARKLLMDNAEYIEPVVIPEYAENKSRVDNAVTNHSADSIQETKLNYTTPRIVLQNMLKAQGVRPAFSKPKLHTENWTDRFIASLMASEYGDYIAKKWAEKDQRLLLKGYIFGMLAETGVMKGSKLSIARACLNVSEKSKVPELVRQVNTFASYMSKSRWKDEPYADWVLEYSGLPQEEV